jgi:D-alanyl-D-alanine carboxypeptidase
MNITRPATSYRLSRTHTPARSRWSVACVALAGTIAIAACSSSSTSPASTSTTPSETTIPSAPVSPSTSDAPTPTVTDVPLTVDVAPSAALTSLLEAERSKIPDSPGQLASVRIAGLEEWHGAIGVIDRVSGEPLVGDEVVRSASLTKTFVAAAVLRLSETGSVGLDDPISSRIRPSLIEPLRKDGYDVDRITIRQLLEHTSGIADYFGSEQDSSTSAYAAAVNADPQRMWTPEEQIQFAADEYEPLSAPGAAYHYSDTGYVLLGQLLADVTGETYPSALRSLLRFEELGLASLRVELLEPAPPGERRAHQYIGTIDSYDANPSYDLYGGGGLVGSMTDLTGFLTALFDGALFDDPQSLQTMTGAGPLSESGAPYGLGRISLGTSACFTNSGALGEFFFVCPDVGVITARSINQSVAPTGYDVQQSFEAQVLDLVRRG